MPPLGLKKLPFPDKVDAGSIVSNQRTAWENFIKLDAFNTLSVTAGATLTPISGTVFANAAAGSLVLALPPASGNAGLTFTVFKTDSTTNTVTLDGDGAETLDGAATLVLGGNLGRSRVTIICDGTAWRIAELYEEGTYPATLTGCTTSPTATVFYVRNGKNVLIKIGTLVATSNTTACTITGAPSHLFPATATAVPVGNINDASNAHLGQVDISTSAVWLLSFYSTITTLTSTFTNVGTKGLGAVSFSYSLL